VAAVAAAVVTGACGAVTRACGVDVNSHDRDDNAAATVVSELAPAGTLRVAINFGNPILVRRDPASGEPRGIVVELTRELAASAGVPFTFVTYDAAAAVADDARSGKWDVAFIAADPARQGDIAFTAPYIELESTYLVPEGSRLKTSADVDDDGVRIAARPRSAYDLALRRSLKRARMVYPEGAETDVDLLRRGEADALAGLRHVLADTAKGIPGSRVLDGNFATIEQALGVPAGHRASVAYLDDFVASIKKSGAVARAIEVSGVQGARVATRGAAPPAASTDSPGR
jgi:polar amino acid transport system substrate-binding protein